MKMKMFKRMIAAYAVSLAGILFVVENPQSVHAASSSTPHFAVQSAVTEYKQRDTHNLNGHDFKVKRATRVVWCKDHICTSSEAGTTQMVSGQISHQLRARPDDQIYYKIRYNDDGMPKDPEVEISRGGVAQWFRFLDDFTLVDGAGFEIAGIKVNVKSPQKAFADASTKLSHLVHGKGWEAQAAAITYAIGLAAINPYPDGTLLRDNNSNAIHIAQGGAVFWVRSPDQFNLMGLDWNAVRILKDNSMQKLPSIPMHGSLLREVSRPHIYVMEKGRKRHIVSPAVFNAVGFNWGDVRVVGDGALDHVPTGAPFEGK